MPFLRTSSICSLKSDIIVLRASHGLEDELPLVGDLTLRKARQERK